MKKRISALILAAVMVFAMAAIPASAETGGTCGDNLTWALDNDGTLTISGTGSMKSWAFSDKSDIKTVIIEDGVTSIGAHAFYECIALTKVIIPESVKGIGEGAFYGCVGLTSVNILNANIGYNAFYGCSGLTSVVIGDGVGSINRYAFEDCAALTNITVSENNEEFSSDSDGILYNKEKTKLIKYPCGKTDKSFVIPNNVVNIGDDAFKDCVALTSIVIPNSVESIGDDAFAFCSGLASVVIPNSVESIGEGAFSSCIGLTSAVIGDGVGNIRISTFSFCTGLTSVSIGKGVWSIDYDAFKNCKALTNITVSENNKKYSSDGNGVLYNKEKTRLLIYPDGKSGSFVIPDGVESIGERAFDNCSGLTSVDIPSSVTSIGNDAFYVCRNLTSVVIPKGVTSIGEGAFEFCNSLTDVYYEGSEADWSGVRIGGDNDCLTNATIHYNYSEGGDDSGKYYTYIVSNGKATITDVDTSISGDITIPSQLGGYSVESIGDSAFRDCYSLTSVVIPSGVTSIGDSAFEGCENLASVDIPESVTSIGNSAFAWCSDLTNVVIPSGVGSIGSGLFFYCSGLTSVDIPDSVTSIGNSAFANCDLKSVIIPGGVTSIEDCAFLNCRKLTDVYYEGSSEAWKNITIGSDNRPLTNATIHYNYIISKAVPTVERDSISVKVKMSEEEKAEASSGKIMLMLFNQSGVAEEMQTKDFAEEVTFDNLDLTKGKAKIFVWESLETMRPLAKSATRSFSFEEE